MRVECALSLHLPILILCVWSSRKCSTDGLNTGSPAWLGQKQGWQGRGGEVGAAFSPGPER